MGATARANNPKEELIPIEEDKMDGTVDVGPNAAQDRNVDNTKSDTTPTDEGEALELMRVHEQTSVSTEASTAGPTVTVCTQVRNVPHMQLNTSPMPPLKICRLDLSATVCETEGWHWIDL